MNFHKRIRRRSAGSRGVGKNIQASLFLLALLTIAFAGPKTEAQQQLSALAKPPDWSRLEMFQETITREEFFRLLTQVYAPNDTWKAIIVVRENDALIAEDGAWSKMFMLRFAKDDTTAKPAPHYWTAASKMPPAPADKPLAGVKIALDPGHLGGKWAKMEERWFVVGNGKPVAEGDMTLLTAKILAKKLRDLGASVFFTRSTPGPVTHARPQELRKAAREQLKLKQILFVRENYTDPTDPVRQNSVQWESERLFYRVSEIHARGRLVNTVLTPDLTICLHYNAEAWGDEKKPTLSDQNHFHLIINGTYEAGELALDDERFEMLMKLLTRSYPEELAISKTVASVMARETGLPPYTYPPPYTSVQPVTGEPYLWIRNLLANRLFRNPTIYVEPYVMNSKLVVDRVQLGDYEGEKEVGGAMRKSIYREYADAVADGLVEYFKQLRKVKPQP